MRALIKSIVSAMTVTALCAANIPAIAADSDVTANDISAADVSEKAMLSNEHEHTENLIDLNNDRQDRKSVV